MLNLFKNYIGLGVAGNFAGHLEQAGEASDFAEVKTKDEQAPKAIFPFYVPSYQLDPQEQFLSQYPLSSETIQFPKLSDADHLQIEPEIALVCEIIYQDNKVVDLIPRHFTAYNDCSIRRPGANKISEKKNWGLCSKGISTNLIEIDKFKSGGIVDHYNIASFLKRGDELNAYGVDSAAIAYSYFHQQLIDWIIERMNNQPDVDPMNNIAKLLAQSNYPTRAIIAIGATRYTPFGQTNFLQKKDKSIIAVYDNRKYSSEDIEQMAKDEIFAPDISALIQEVI